MVESIKSRLDAANENHGRISEGIAWTEARGAVRSRGLELTEQGREKEGMRMMSNREVMSRVSYAGQARDS